MGALDYHPAHLILQQKVKIKEAFTLIPYTIKLICDRIKKQKGVKPRPKTHKKRVVS